MVSPAFVLPALAAGVLGVCSAVLRMYNIRSIPRKTYTRSGGPRPGPAASPSSPAAPTFPRVPAGT